MNSNNNHHPNDTGRLGSKNMMAMQMEGRVGSRCSNARGALNSYHHNQTGFMEKDKYPSNHTGQFGLLTQMEILLIEKTMVC